jgi:hypothetical protein
MLSHPSRDLGKINADDNNLEGVYVINLRSENAVISDLMVILCKSKKPGDTCCFQLFNKV